MRDDTIATLTDDVVDLLLAGEEPGLAALSEQYRRADEEVTVTGSGLFVEFDLPADVPTAPGNGDATLGGVGVRAEELDHGMGFVLFVEGGRLSLLEGFTYEEPLPDRLTNVRLVRTDDGSERRPE